MLKENTEISIHALRVEGDNKLEETHRNEVQFLSTPSGWRATSNCLPCISPLLNYFYPRPPGGGRPEIDYVLNCMQRISIHALRVEGDLLLYLCSQNAEIISIHALRVEGDEQGYNKTASDALFLSTPSGWRATAMRKASNDLLFIFLSTPSGWRATLIANRTGISRPISIHALRVEGDYRYRCMYNKQQ